MGQICQGRRRAMLVTSWKPKLESRTDPSGRSGLRAASGTGEQRPDLRLGTEADLGTQSQSKESQIANLELQLAPR
jgi:hypothetical protein